MPANYLQSNSAFMIYVRTNENSHHFAENEKPSFREGEY